jgi:hypothetical protein
MNNILMNNNKMNYLNKMNKFKMNNRMNNILFQYFVSYLIYNNQ